MTVSSGVVTDQSSVIFEAMFIGIPFVILIGRGQRDLFFESTYLKREDWNSFIAEDASEAFRKISSPSYLVECLNLKNRYIQNSITGSYTQDIVMHLEKFRSKGTK
jgi:CDP-glycerol glycerophosphotransferase (TagB/SpsB family)